MKTMKNLAILFSLIFVAGILNTGFRFAEQREDVNPTMHVILIADVYSNIAEACGIDERNMEDLVQKIGRLTGMEVRVHEAGFSRDEVQDAVAAINAGRDDVILFYYTGHGYRHNDQSDPFPYMNLTTGGGHPYDIGLSMKWVNDQLTRKGARLTLTLGDLCNSIIDLPEPGSELEVGQITEAYKRLFLYSHGEVLMCSSKAGQYSIATRSGSHFTNAFLEALDTEARGEGAYSITWEQVLDQTINMTMSLSGGEQLPYYEADVEVGRQEAESTDVVLPTRRR